MKFKELLTVLDSNASEKGELLYEGKVIFYYKGGLINEHMWSISYSNICYGCEDND